MLLAAPVLDQQAPGESTIEFFGEHFVQQEVVAGIAGELGGFELSILFGEFPLRFTVRSTLGGPDLFSQVLTVSTGPVFVNTAAADIALDVGEHFFIGVQSAGGGALAFGASLPGQYGPGDAFLDGILFVQALGRDDVVVDLGFRTFVSVNSVPEPSSMALFCAGLAGLGFGRLSWRRRQQRRTVAAP